MGDCEPGYMLEQPRILGYSPKAVTILQVRPISRKDLARGILNDYMPGPSREGEDIV